MIPATYPSILDSSNRTKMLVYQVPSIVGLTRWIDYIPVKSPASESDLTLANTFANEGFILTSKVNDITGLVPFKDYVPIYLDSTATKAWSADNDGYIPMAELAGLLLDFTTGALDPRIAFTRATNATVTNSAGQITYAPHNLLTFSEQFDNAAWTKTNSTISANVTTAPDGTITADKLVENTTAGSHSVNVTATSLNATEYTYTIYAKAGERNWLLLWLNTAGAYFDVQNGVIGTISSGVSASITFVENGWYRCSVTRTVTAGNNPCFVYMANANNSFSYTGNGNSGIYIWGAQLEIGSTATTYNSTTVKNLLGYSELFDNAAWTKSNSFVQTNLLTYSEDFSNAAWTKSNTTVTANSAISPNGYQTADKLIADTNVNTHTTGNGFAVVLGNTYTISAYFKAEEYSTAAISLVTGFPTTSVLVNLSTGVASTGTGTPLNVLSTPVGNGWYRLSFSLVATSTTTAFTNIYVINGSSWADRLVAGDGTSGIYAWGAQLVQGSDAGAYRRTDSASLPCYYPNHNGVVCAEKLVATTASSTHFINQAATTVAGTTMTYSVYLKAGGYNFAVVYIGGANVGRYFNLSTGTVGNTFIGSPLSESITSIGDGWYRCSITYTATASSTATVYVNASQSSSFAGDGTSGIYIFGAQLSDSASLDPYVLNAAAAPTAAAYYGPRFDYDPVTLAPKGLLIEEQRSNLLVNSSILGTLLSTQSVTVTAVAHTLSFYGTGTVTITGTYVGSLVGSGAYPTRSTLTFTPTAGVVLLTVTGNVQFAQLEIGAVATSFIPTAASQVTRAADVATIQGSNFYSWYNQNEGTLLTNTNRASITQYGYYAAISNGSTNNVINLAGWNNSTDRLSIVTNSSTEAVLFNSVTSITSKSAGSFVLNNINLSTNTNLAITDTSATLPIVNKIDLGADPSRSFYLNGTIKLLSYFPQRLSNDVLKGLTA